MSSPKIRCAIYTRKSSEEKLDQTFKSLDAQREACAAYIASQRHEGWKAVKTCFDDGGLSGGTLETVLYDAQRLRHSVSATVRFSLKTFRLESDLSWLKWL